MKKLKITLAGAQDLSRVRQVISLESHSVECQGTVLKRHFNDLVQSANATIGGMFGKLFGKTGLGVVPSRNLLSLVQQTKYTDMDLLQVDVPEGLAVPYLSYLDVLINAQKRANRLIPEVLDPYMQYLGSLINQPQARTGNKSFATEIEDLEQSQIALNKDFNVCFEKNNFQTTRPYQDMVKRNTDLPAVLQQTQDLANLYTSFNAKAVQDKLERLYRLLDQVVILVDTDAFDQSRESLTKSLADGLYVLAREVELASLTTWRSKLFITAINTTIEKTESVLKAK